MDDVSFDFMDAMAPGCTALIPKGGAVGLTALLSHGARSTPFSCTSSMPPHPGGDMSVGCVV